MKRQCRTPECTRDAIPHSPYCSACFRAILSRATRAAM